MSDELTPASITMKTNPEMFSHYIVVLELFAETIKITTADLYKKLGIETLRRQLPIYEVDGKKYGFTLVILPKKFKPYPDVSIKEHILDKLSEESATMTKEYITYQINKIRVFYQAFVHNYAYLFADTLMADQERLSDILMEIKVDNNLRLYLDEKGRRIYINLSEIS